ncbi:MAG: 4Fe-4S dicluster domain-containing protein [Candidatus Latescibacterota bacterium]
MSKSSNKKDDIVKVNFEFRRALAEKIEGDLASFCYQCGACVGDCPSMTYGGTFNPRDIMLKVLYGLGEELLVEDSILWECTNCYNCHERCPQEVKPVEVIISLKNMLADLGIYPDAVERVIENFEKTGLTVQLSAAVDRQREKYGLPPMKPPPIDEIQKLIEPSPQAMDSAAASKKAAAPKQAAVPKKAAAPADNKGDKE